MPPDRLAPPRVGRRHGRQSSKPVPSPDEPKHRMRIIDRYLLRELTRSFIAVNAVLLLVTFGGVLTDVLNKIARGKLPATLLLAQVGLRSLDALAIILPLGMFLTVLLAYGRLYRDSIIEISMAASTTCIAGSGKD